MMSLARAIMFFLVLVGLGACVDARLRDAIYYNETAPRAQVNASLWSKQALPISKSYSYLHEGRADQPVIIYLHGNEQTASIRTHFQPHLIKAGYTIVIPEYPGYSDLSTYEADERAIVNVAKESVAIARSQYPDREVYLVGRSLGGAFAAIAASEVKVDGLLTVAAFTRTRDFAPDMPDWVFQSQPIDVLSVAPKIRAPWVIYHCHQDPIVPAYMQRQLLATAQSASLQVKDALTNCNYHDMKPEHALEALNWLKAH